MPVIVAGSEGDWVALVVVVLAGAWKCCVGTTVVIRIQNAADLKAKNTYFPGTLGVLASIP